MTLTETVLANVARLREMGGVKGVHLATALGVSPPAVVKMLTRGDLQCATVDRLAAALGVPTVELTTPKGSKRRDRAVVAAGREAETREG